MLAHRKIPYPDRVVKHNPLCCPNKIHIRPKKMYLQ